MGPVDGQSTLYSRQTDPNRSVTQNKAPSDVLIPPGKFLGRIDVYVSASSAAPPLD